MALSLSDELDATFGPDAFAHALFYRHSTSLRFELESGETYIAQFLQAVDRARAVLNTAFAGAETVTAVLEVWGDRPPRAAVGRPLWAGAEAALRVLGMDIVGPNTARLAQLDNDFGAWLLDHDRARMAEMFGFGHGSKKP